MTIMKMIGQISTHKHNSTFLLLEQRIWTEKETRTIMKMIGQTNKHKQNPTLLLLEQRFWTEKETNYEILIQRTKNTIISDKRVRKRPADASLTNQQGPKSTSQPGSTITVSQCLTGCRIQCDRAHPTPLSFYAQLPILVLEFEWNCLLGNTINTLAALGHLGHIMNSGVVSDLL